ncbi:MULTISPECIES: LON peptidase substrate-binding domain-containing protein [unclassified Arenibacter]|uniref:LON peptidase substrate-binding domain-containing protein n=1 Tax=unclassified Arenibacter TaxID=2615047 RepID=UPI000E34E7AC|nr:MULTISPECIES: LON peptidase substrate-binding domain-containing protein [unclassified Arenibacter]MCM4165594.1 ATP-dependent protease [Arenibacter sp. A80]RFT54744.1 ATP-dependent protease [Arenibacter sp. P308M17]
MLLPLFPLPSVFFQEEIVALHIFEERYKQLIRDVREESSNFGVPVYIDGEMTYGTELELKEIVKTYDTGEMDIVCVGRRLFKINTFQKNMDGKLYAGGDVEFLPYYDDSVKTLKENVLGLVMELYGLMDVSILGLTAGNFDIYQLIHKIGLSLAQEYKLLKMAYKSERLLFIKAHLTNTIQVLKQVNQSKEMIGMNGHFKNFDPIDFKDFKM